MQSALAITDSVPKPKLGRPPAPSAAVVHPKLALITPRPRGKKSLWKIGALLSVVASVGILLLMQSSFQRPAPPGPAQAEALPGGELLAEDANQMIVLKGDSEAIIGQLAKIPAEHEHITEIKAVSEIDSNAGRELLSIISKY